MRLRSVVMLLAAVPLLLAIGAVVWIVRQQAVELAGVQIEAVQPILRQARQEELQHFVQVGRGAISHLVRQAGKDPAKRREALELLRSMDFGDDNYFFVYDLQGNSLMHPRLPDLEGHSQWDLRDSVGNPIIQQLIEKARSGGGFVDYMWNRPSTGREERKLGYVELIPEWNWMIGTGLYLDELQQTQALIKRSTAAAVGQTLNQVLLAASVALTMVAAGGLALNLYEQRAADSKLRTMAHKVVLSQETERSRVARELHDGVIQWLASVKFVFESALVHVERGTGDAAGMLRDGLAQMRGVMRDVRRISHDLRPTLLDDLGLSSAIEQIAREFGERTGIAIETRVDPLPEIAEAAATAMFRVVQEALGNVEKHAGAQHVWLRLLHDDAGLQLELRDDGCGFDVVDMVRQAREGLGLTNMRERMETLGGQFRLQSAPGMTVLSASLPLAALKT
jgi:two-component system, NarL family, sensor kinase